ncbi:hypothetical protein CXG81DRAFT_24582 [Caulochytrium protostelioides]|uniref:Ribosomal RNA-processing protein 7 C-terminal domain-containing protein n=1 Tax=Caulochytrium protostelioides TaxID=1555241 RepID=A0A4P9WW72_9FUNG|nr:hypothetical protein CAUPRSCDRAFT_10763 [Caulochytrium protostelioides]RKP02794.1 hypothetical protein CXG81DRAFT_24582 [Caulochytrium protostelioides]|eukprot:RKP02794.1 hypothetical protein CXG81DRAFT_24582 [Caulochytrium protostelioides]
MPATTAPAKASSRKAKRAASASTAAPMTPAPTTPLSSGSRSQLPRLDAHFVCLTLTLPPPSAGAARKGETSSTTPAPGTPHVCYVRQHIGGNTAAYGAATANEDDEDDDAYPADRTWFVVNPPVDSCHAKWQGFLEAHPGMEAMTVPAPTPNPTTAADEDDEDFETPTEPPRIVDLVWRERREGGNLLLLWDRPVAVSLLKRPAVSPPTWGRLPATSEAGIPPPEPVGFEAYARSYLTSRPAREAHRRSVHAYMQQFDRAEAAAREAAEAAARDPLPDADGFVLVTGRGTRRTASDRAGDASAEGGLREAGGRQRRGIRDGAGAVVTSLPRHVAQRLKPKERVWTDFYRFQIRDAQRAKFASLRERQMQEQAVVAQRHAAGRFVLKSD